MDEGWNGNPYNMVEKNEDEKEEERKKRNTDCDWKANHYMNILAMDQITEERIH